MIRIIPRSMEEATQSCWWPPASLSVARDGPRSAAAALNPRNIHTSRHQAFFFEFVRGTHEVFQKEEKSFKL